MVPLDNKQQQQQKGGKETVTTHIKFNKKIRKSFLSLTLFRFFLFFWCVGRKTCFFMLFSRCFLIFYWFQRKLVLTFLWQEGNGNLKNIYVFIVTIRNKCIIENVYKVTYIWGVIVTSGKKWLLYSVIINIFTKHNMLILLFQFD